MGRSYHFSRHNDLIRDIIRQKTERRKTVRNKAGVFSTRWGVAFDLEQPAAG
jgi:hypothetical protein